MLPTQHLHPPSINLLMKHMLTQAVKINKLIKNKLPYFYNT